MGPAHPGAGRFAVGVVGATGAVGEVLLSILAARPDRYADVRAFASEQSAGLQLPFRDGHVTVELTGTSTFDGLDLVFLCVEAPVAASLAPRVAASGAVCIDNSSAFRRSDDVPLVVPEINAGALDAHQGIVANANCTTIINVLVAAALHDAFGLVSMDVTSVQAVSGAGKDALDRMFRETSRALETGLHEADDLAFNLIPRIGDSGPDGRTEEETKLRVESRKILGLPNLQVDAFCTRAGIVQSHTVSTTATFERSVSLGAARKRVDESPGLRFDESGTANAAVGLDDVLVTRLEARRGDPRSLKWIVIGDQLRKGAAWNAAQIAEALVERDLLGPR